MYNSFLARQPLVPEAAKSEIAKQLTYYVKTNVDEKHHKTDLMKSGFARIFVLWVSLFNWRKGGIENGPDMRMGKGKAPIREHCGG